MCKFNPLLIAGLALASAFTLASTPAFALPQLVMDIDPSEQGSATISYNGGAGPLVGAGIAVVEFITGMNGTPFNNNVEATCLSCVLSFTTGTFIGSDTTNWFFGGGGSISLVGGVDFGGGQPNISPGTTLLSGSFSSAQVTTVVNNELFKDITASFIDQKDDDLVAFWFGNNLPIAWNGNLNLRFKVATTFIIPPASFQSVSVRDGDIINESVPASPNNPVPEPSTMLLLGSGLVGLIGYRMRKVQA